MAKTFDYHREAELCLEAAEKAASSENRKFLLAMARVWANLASHDEAQARMAPPLPGDAEHPPEHRTIS